MECGNGIVQASEECDDANTDPGDGCDACSLEVSGTESDTGADVGLDEGNGCECRVHDSGPVWMGLLSLFGVFALRPRHSR